MLTRRILLSSAGSVIAVAPALCALPVDPPALETPLQRAARHWRAFAAAMNEVAADADGWVINGAHGGHGCHGGLTLATRHFDREAMSHTVGMIVENRKVLLLPR